MLLPGLPSVAMRRDSCHTFAMHYQPFPPERSLPFLSSPASLFPGRDVGVLLAKDRREEKHVVPAVSGDGGEAPFAPPCHGLFYSLDGEVRERKDAPGEDEYAVKLLSFCFAHGWKPVSLCGTAPVSEVCRPLIALMCRLDVVWTDGVIAVVEKPAGLLSVPGNGEDKQDCVVNRLKRLFPRCIFQPSVHRLDMDTSGLLVYGLTREAQAALSAQFARGEVYKEYEAVLDGVLTKDEGVVDLSIRPDWENRPRQMYDPVGGKRSVTVWKKVGLFSLADGRAVTRLRFIPQTGRTHQLRLHSALKEGLACPIVGDRLYGKRREGERLMLHAGVLRFAHPGDGRVMEFRSPAPF